MKLLSCLLLFFSLSACYYDNEEELYPASNICQTGNLTFLQDIQPIIARNCASPACHVSNGSGNGVFETYEGIKEKVDNGSFRNRTIVIKDMPPSASLSSCDIKKLESWLNNGAQNN